VFVVDVGGEGFSAILRRVADGVIEVGPRLVQSWQEAIANRPGDLV
jgi:hypothetical protein